MCAFTAWEKEVFARGRAKSYCRDSIPGNGNDIVVSETMDKRNLESFSAELIVVVFG